MKGIDPSADTSANLISVIIPAYNAEQHLSDTIESALHQSHRNLEVIVVDDGSTDETPRIVTQIAETDSRVKLIQQPNGGVARARNAALAVAQGTLIAPLDADDLWHPNKLAVQAQAMERAGPDCGLVYVWACLIDQAGDISGRLSGGAAFEGDVFGAVVIGSFIASSSVPLIRRVALEAVGGFDPALRDRRGEGFEDHALYLALAQDWQFALVPQVLVGYRQSPSSMSDDLESMETSHLLVMSDFAARVPALPARFVSWGRSGAYFFLLRKAVSHRAYQRAAGYVVKILLRDPLYMAYRLYRFLKRIVLNQRGQTVRPGTPFASLDPELAGGRSSPDWLWVRRARRIAETLGGHGAG